MDWHLSNRWSPSSHNGAVHGDHVTEGSRSCKRIKVHCCVFAVRPLLHLRLSADVAPWQFRKMSGTVLKQNFLGSTTASWDAQAHLAWQADWILSLQTLLAPGSSAYSLVGGPRRGPRKL